MRVEQAFLCHFRYVEIAELGSLVFVKEDVCTLHVSVQDFELVQRFKSFDNLDDNLPNVLLLHKLLVVLTFTDPLKHVAIVCELHHDTTTVE